MLKMEIFRLRTTNGDKRLGMIIIFLIYRPLIQIVDIRFGMSLLFSRVTRVQGEHQKIKELFSPIFNNKEALQSAILELKFYLILFTIWLHPNHL
jgi:Ni,Fe-hydrogenase I cytochrome b subunit